jgi:hypothetical protein
LHLHIYFLRVVSEKINKNYHNGYIHVDVSSEEVYHEEEDVVCSQPVVPFVGM